MQNLLYRQSIPGTGAGARFELPPAVDPDFTIVPAAATTAVLLDAVRALAESTPFDAEVQLSALDDFAAELGIPSQDGQTEMSHVGLDAGAHQVEGRVATVRMGSGHVPSGTVGQFDARREACLHDLLHGLLVLLGGQVLPLEPLPAVRPDVEEERRLARVRVLGRAEQRRLQLVAVHPVLARLVLEDGDGVLPVGLPRGVLQGADCPPALAGLLCEVFVDQHLHHFGAVCMYRRVDRDQLEQRLTGCTAEDVGEDFSIGVDDGLELLQVRTAHDGAIEERLGGDIVHGVLDGLVARVADRALHLDWFPIFPQLELPLPI
ncbi:hypothetical protein PG984_004985 [Apiospora sp. TS-2023a]